MRRTQKDNEDSHRGITRRTLGYRIQKYGLADVVEENIRRLREGRGGRG